MDQREERIASYVQSAEAHDKEVDDAPTGGLVFLAYVLAVAVGFNWGGLAQVHPLLTAALIAAAVGLAHIEAAKLRRAVAAARMSSVEKVCAIVAANPGTANIPVRPPKGYFVDDQWHF